MKIVYYQKICRIIAVHFLGLFWGGLILYIAKRWMILYFTFIILNIITH